jgi:methylated-DNA-[protein]-cysteine S-methyltransferase
MARYQWSMKSPLGPLFLLASEKGLSGIYWDKQNVPLQETPLLTQAVQELTEYFEHKRKKFDVPLDLQGTPFQKSVWEQLLKIPYGKTCSYAEIAKRLLNPRAVRAVGAANGKNPVCVIVPCHRVIASDGSLGGYSGGLHIKTQLLAIEAP